MRRTALSAASAVAAVVQVTAPTPDDAPRLIAELEHCAAEWARIRAEGTDLNVTSGRLVELITEALRIDARRIACLSEITQLIELPDHLKHLAT